MPGSTPTPTTAATVPAATHAHAAELLRRPFAPGAVGFRAMTKVALDGDPYGGANIAAFIGAQSVMQRLNTVVPGCWRADRFPVAGELLSSDAKKIYLACRITISLPLEEGSPVVDAAYEDIGEMDKGSFAGLKQLYSDALKRAAVVAGIGAYLYTSLEPVVLKIGNQDGQVQVQRRNSNKDQLILSPVTQQWLRDGYRARMRTDAVRRDLGDMLPHGEPETGMGQGEVGEQAANPPDTSATAAAGSTPDVAADSAGKGVVRADFGEVGPAAA